MKVKKSLFIIAILALSLSSCIKEGKSVETTQACDNYNPEFLFEVDGVRVYRFGDGGRAIYFTNTTGSVEWNEHHTNGKTQYTVKKQTLCNEQNQ